MRGGGSLRTGGSYRGAGSLRGACGRSCRSGLSTLSEGSLREGLTGTRLGSFTSGRTGASLGYVRSGLTGRSLAPGIPVASRSPPVLSLRGSERGVSRGGREAGKGRVTAPVGRASTGSAPEVGTGNCGRAITPSRPFRTLVRRSSSSSCTPGKRAAAPVGLSISSTGGATLAGRATVTRPP